MTGDAVGILLMIGALMGAVSTGLVALVWRADPKQTCRHCWYWRSYAEGVQSRRGKEGKQRNPYTYGTEEHDAWNEGWSGTP